MKRFLRILALVVLGFALGGGAAYVTQVHKARLMQANFQPIDSHGKPVTPSAPGRIEVTQGPDGRLKAHHLKHADSDIADKPADDKKNGTDNAAATSGGDDVTAAADAPLMKPAPAKPAPVATPYSHLSPPIGIYVPGTFKLKDTEGKDVSETSWPDKYLLVFFGYTHCPDICPVTLQKMTAALDKLGPLARKVQPLFITIDPERDSPEAIKNYLSHYHNSLIGLTGTGEQIKAAEESYKVYADPIPGRDDGEYTFDHSAYMYFMSPRNVLEQAFRVDQPTTVVVDKMRPYLDGSAKAKALAP